METKSKYLERICLDKKAYDRVPARKMQNIM